MYDPPPIHPPREPHPGHPPDSNLSPTVHIDGLARRVRLCRSVPPTVREAVLEIRILLSQMPWMLRDILADAIGRERDLRLVGTDDAETELIERINSHRPDVLLVGEPTEPDHRGWHELLGAFPRLKVLAVEGSARRAALYELTPRRTHLGEASPGLLTYWIRQSAQPMALTTVDGTIPLPDAERDPSVGLFTWPAEGDRP